MGFNSEISRVAERIRDLSATCPVGFFFLTDLHVPSNHGESASLLVRLIGETGIRNVVCGGDIPEAFGDRASLDASVARYRDLWVAAVERAGGDFLPVHGNHDLAIRLAADSSEGFTYPAEDTRAILLDTAAVCSRATVAGRTFDFSGARGGIPLALSGHYHAELQSCVGGVWHVTEPCDAAYLDYINRSAPWCPDLPVKEPDTWAGQTFDAVQIDPARGLVHFTRIGGGSDRTLHLAPLVLQVGASMRLSAPGLGDGPLFWGAYDAGRATSRPNPARKYDYFTDYYNTVADIAPDGTVRAISSGEAVAVARAADGTREYFPVTVCS